MVRAEPPTTSAVSSDTTELRPWVSMLSAGSRLHGIVEKKGIPPLDLWHPTAYYNATLFQMWLRDMVVESALATTAGQAAPVSLAAPPRGVLSKRCAVIVNHHYKFIFVRNRKTASTALKAALDTLCRSGANKHACSEDIMSLDEQSPEEAQQMWQDYFVFTTSRNPWARAASGFEYCRSRWTQQTGPCESPNFLQFCRQPYLLGAVGQLFKCNRMSTTERMSMTGLSNGRGKASDEWNSAFAFDFYHVAPHAECVATPEGDAAVDFVIRYENLHEDVNALLAELNARRGPEVPELVLPPLVVIKSSLNGGGSVEARKREHRLVHAMLRSVASGAAGSSATETKKTSGGSEDSVEEDTAARHAAKYLGCGRGCAEAIARSFEQDISFFGYPQPSDLLPPSSEGVGEEGTRATLQ